MAADHARGGKEAMRAYVGDTRSRKLLSRLREEGIGQIIIRGKLPGRRLDLWAYDNGAFVDWKHGRPFDGARFLADLEHIASMKTALPAFAVLPDDVASADSLRLSMQWLDRLEQMALLPVPMYLAVQDGMKPDGIPWKRGFSGIFMGGTLEWKVRNAPRWAQAARDHGRAFHYARCGTRRRIMQAKAIRADSIDSCLPLFSRDNLRIFLDALRQQLLFFEVE